MVYEIESDEAGAATNFVDSTAKLQWASTLCHSHRLKLLEDRTMQAQGRLSPGSDTQLQVAVETKNKLDLVCRKRAVSNRRPACRKAFLKFVVLLVFTRVSRSML